MEKLSSYSLNKSNSKSISIVRGRDYRLEVLLRHHSFQPLQLSREGFDNLRQICQRIGHLSDEDFDENSRKIHEFVQWYDVGQPIVAKVVSLNAIVKTKIDDPPLVMDIRILKQDETKDEYLPTPRGWCCRFSTWNELVDKSKLVAEELQNIEPRQECGVEAWLGEDEVDGRGVTKPQPTFPINRKRPAQKATSAGGKKMKLSVIDEKPNVTAIVRKLDSIKPAAKKHMAMLVFECLRVRAQHQDESYGADGIDNKAIVSDGGAILAWLDAEMPNVCGLFPGPLEEAEKLYHEVRRDFTEDMKVVLRENSLAWKSAVKVLSTVAGIYPKAEWFSHDE